MNLVYVFFLYLFQMLQFIQKEKSLFFIAIVFSLEYLMILYILYLISFGQKVFQKFAIVPLGS